MNKSKTYTQCLLSLNEKQDVAYIPSQYAKVGKILKIKDDTNAWINGWKVEKTYFSEDEEYVLSHERDWDKQRKASDI